MFGEVYSGTRTPLSPAEFLREWWRFAAGLAGDRQQDAHEFFLSLLEGLAGSMLPLPGLLEADDAQRGSAGSGGSGGSAPDNAAANGGGVPPLPLALSQPQPPQQQQRQQQHGGASPLLQGQAAGGVTPYGCWRQTPVPSSLLGGELSGCETPVSSAIMTPEPDCGPDGAPPSLPLLLVSPVHALSPLLKRFLMHKKPQHPLFAPPPLCCWLG